MRQSMCRFMWSCMHSQNFVCWWWWTTAGAGVGARSCEVGSGGAGVPFGFGAGRVLLGFGARSCGAGVLLADGAGGWVGARVVFCDVARGSG
jgi:hypothetical protein